MQRYKKIWNRSFPFTSFRIRMTLRGNQMSECKDSRIEILSHVGFLVAIGLSAWFHELRNTFGESAMVLFNLINEPDFFAKSTWLSIHWFQNIITIFAVKCNFSLSSVSLVFSMAPMVFMYGVFMITHYVFKQKYSGVFLLLLFFGINQTFFSAIHTPLILVTTIYFIVTALRTIVKKINPKAALNDHIWASQGLVYAFIFLISLIGYLPTNPYLEVIEGDHAYSFWGYVFSVAISAYVIPFFLLACLLLYWWQKKQYVFFLQLSFFTLIMFGWMMSNGRHGALLDLNYELLFFPLIASIVAAFVFVFTKEFQQTKTKFWILSTLVFFAVFGQIRSLQTFETRKNHVVRLLEHIPTTGQKHAISEKLQLLEKYIDPTYLAFETPIIASLRGLPPQSVYFIPTEPYRRVPSIPTNIPNSHFFQFSNQEYLISEVPFIPRALYRVLGDSSFTITGGRIHFALTVRTFLNRADSVAISVERNGSDFGRLVMADDLPEHIKFWLGEQVVSEPDDEGWQRLSSSWVVQEKDWFRIYVWNENARNERILFRRFRIEIWRE